MSVAFTSDQWWKNGVLYCLDVQSRVRARRTGTSLGRLARLAGP